MKPDNEIFPQRKNDTIVLTQEQLTILKQELVKETKEAIKEEVLMDLGRFTYESGKGFLIRFVQMVGVVGLLASYYLHSKGILPDIKL